MRRISAPANDALYRDYDAKIPHGIKSAVVRALVRIVLSGPDNIIWRLAQNETKPEMFEIKVKE